MKCPKCGMGMVRRHICPECGRFMKYGVETFPDGATLDRFWLCKCGHEEKVKP